MITLQTPFGQVSIEQKFDKYVAAIGGHKISSVDPQFAYESVLSNHIKPQIVQTADRMYRDLTTAAKSNIVVAIDPATAERIINEWRNIVTDMPEPKTTNIERDLAEMYDMVARI